MAAGKFLRVGLTGSIAAGKSTVSSWLKERGYLVINADRLGHACMKPDTPGFNEIVAEFGDSILTSNGEIDRPSLGRLVFANPSRLQILNRILHPRIRAAEQAALTRCQNSTYSGIAVTEAALLVETRGYLRYDRLIVVVAPQEIRHRRLLDSGLSEHEARARMASQLPQSDKVAVADYVVDNGATLEETCSRVTTLCQLLERDLDRLRKDKPLCTPGTL